MKKKSSLPVIIWLISGCVLLFSMVVIGGITRLTHSGLSMVDWKPIMGTLPPLDEAQWTESFSRYQQTPEYKLINYDFGIEDYKSIFWWEYIHRLMGRFIGIVFLIPFVIFTLQKRFDRKMIIKLVILLLLGGSQGLLGWYMVKSGLVNNPAVSHYRLAAHLLTAFLIICYTSWLIFEIVFERKASSQSNRAIKILSWSFVGVVVLQIFYGALVAGLKAGLLYNTFPKMGDSWIAESVSYAYSENGIMAFFENPASVQFMHRTLGIIVFLFAIANWNYAKRRFPSTLLTQASLYIVISVSFQFILGVLTLIWKVPVVLGVLHQFGALFVLLSTVYLIFLIIKTEKLNPS